jgi:nucleoside phosphorylase
MAAENDFKGGVVVVTTMDTEFRAMRDHLDSWSEDWHKAGTYFVPGRMKDVPWPVILMITGPGNTGSSALGERAIQTFEPRALLLVGVAGSLKDDVKLGDVVVADWIHSYHGGKEDEDGFHARPRGGPAGHRLEQVAYAASLTVPWWKPLTGEVRPRVHVKPIASGEVLLNSPAASLSDQLDRGGLRELLRRHYNDAAAIEMESAGAIRAAQLNDGLPFLAIRGISDRADGTKRGDADRELQPLAAAHAAAFAAAFLRKLAEAEAARGPGRPAGTARGSGRNGSGRTSAPGLGELLFSTRIDDPAGQLVVGFGAEDTLLVAEKNAAVHRWSLKDPRARLTGMPRGEALRGGINVVASSVIPAMAIARDRKLVLVHFGQDRHATSERRLRPDEFLITAAGERLATYDGRRVAVRDFGDGSVLWEQPCPSNLATATIDQTGTAIAMAAGPGMFSSSNKVTVVTQDDAAPREFSYDNLPLGAGCVLGLSPQGALVACASFREVVLARPADRQVLRRRRLGGWQEVVPALGARPQRLICTPAGTVLWLRGRRIAVVRWDAAELHYLSQDGECDDIAYDPVGSRLAIVSQSGQVAVWEWHDDA